MAWPPAHHGLVENRGRERGETGKEKERERERASDYISLPSHFPPLQPHTKMYTNICKHLTLTKYGLLEKPQIAGLHPKHYIDHSYQFRCSPAIYMSTTAKKIYKAQEVSGRHPA